MSTGSKALEANRLARERCQALITKSDGHLDGVLFIQDALDTAVELNPYMDKVDQLFVRACKVSDSRKRLGTLYRHVYGKFEDNHMRKCVVGRLAQLCDKYDLCSTYQLLQKLDEHRFWAASFGQAVIPMEGEIYALSSFICFAEADKFPGLTPPVSFRRKWNRKGMKPVGG